MLTYYSTLGLCAPHPNTLKRPNLNKQCYYLYSANPIAKRSPKVSVTRPAQPTTAVTPSMLPTPQPHPLKRPGNNGRGASLLYRATVHASAVSSTQTKS